jgi:hypothetical protein
MDEECIGKKCLKFINDDGASIYEPYSFDPNYLACRFCCNLPIVKGHTRKENRNGIRVEETRRLKKFTRSTRHIDK